MTYISFVSKYCDVKFGMHVVKHYSILWNLQIVHINPTFLIFRCLKRVGSVKSRPELDPFLYIWYHTVRTKNGLSPHGLSIFRPHIDVNIAGDFLYARHHRPFGREEDLV